MKKVCPVCKGEYEGGEVFCPVDAARLVTASQVDAGAGASDDPLVGQTFDKYEVRRRIGEGGMGLVYEAQHTVIQKRVAIKVLRDDFSRRPEVVERFRQEAISASRIGHQNIVDISDFGTTPTGSSYFVMEYLEGEDLANVLAREVVLPMGRTVRILQQCCRALGAAHEKGIVHRDIKPENIFLVNRADEHDFVKIVDFGIAKMSDIETEGEPGRKLTKTGMIFGTPEYMSPEQAAGKELDHRVDIYAIGAILFECLTGRVPFVGDSFMGILTQHMFEEPPPLREVNPKVEVSAELEMVVYKALAKDPADRYQTMAELGEALEEALEGRVSKATLMGHGEPVKAKPRPPRSIGPALPTDEFPTAEGGSKTGLIALMAVLLVAVGAGGVYFFLKGDPEPRSELIAQASTTDPPDPVAAPPEPEPQPEVAPEPEVEPQPEAPTSVPVTVTTRPGDGAEVSVDGDVEGCEATPCDIQVPPGETVTIHARRGRYAGEIEVTPESATTVQVVLVPRRSRTPMRGTMRPRMTTTSTSMMAGELKVPTIFQ